MMLIRNENKNHMSDSYSRVDIVFSVGPALPMPKHWCLFIAHLGMAKFFQNVSVTGVPYPKYLYLMIHVRTTRMAVDSIVRGWIVVVIISVSNGSGPSLQLRVGVQPEPSRNWWSGWAINLNRRLGYGSMVNSQPVSNGRVVSGSPCESIHRFN